MSLHTVEYIALVLALVAILVGISVRVILLRLNKIEVDSQVSPTEAFCFGIGLMALVFYTLLQLF